jgi:hypothetical protein
MAATEELRFFTVAMIQIPAGPSPGTYIFFCFLDRERLSSGGWPGRPAHSICHCVPSVFSFALTFVQNWEKNILPQEYFQDVLFKYVASW